MEVWGSEACPKLFNKEHWTLILRRNRNILEPRKYKAKEGDITCVRQSSITLRFLSSQRDSPIHWLPHPCKDRGFSLDERHLGAAQQPITLQIGNWRRQTNLDPAKYLAQFHKTEYGLLSRIPFDFLLLPMYEKLQFPV